MVCIHILIESLDKKKAKLHKAIHNKRSRKWCLRLWSDLIKTRDEYKCVNCKSNIGVQAHHIMRRTVCSIGAFEIGNGITLCGECHKKVHEQFNGKPFLNEHLNARGGDDQDEMAYLYGILYEDARLRGIPENEFYYVSDDFLAFINQYQGYEVLVENIDMSEISRLRLVHEIWRNMPLNWYKQLFEEVLYEAAISAENSPNLSKRYPFSFKSEETLLQ